MTDRRFLVVLSTCPDQDTATALARTVLEAGLAACVNVVPAVRSMYVWNGSLRTDDEVLLIVKTTADRFDRLRETLVESHPYEVPEVVALDVAAGHDPYLAWVADPGPLNPP